MKNKIWFFVRVFRILTKMINDTKMEERRLSKPKKGFIVDNIC